MERATIYRAISAPSALVGGTLSLLMAGVWMGFQLSTEHGGELPARLVVRWFLPGWLVVLALTGATNLVILWSDARRRGDPFLSAGMKLAISAMSPSLAAATVLTVFLTAQGYILVLPWVWVVFYGLALLSTAPFAPRSIERLGLLFLCTGLGVMMMPVFSPESNPATTSALFPHLLMAFTFGFFHLLYAAGVWLGRPTRADA